MVPMKELKKGLPDEGTQPANKVEITVRVLYETQPVPTGFLVWRAVNGTRISIGPGLSKIHPTRVTCDEEIDRQKWVDWAAGERLGVTVVHE